MDKEAVRGEKNEGKGTEEAATGRIPPDMPRRYLPMLNTLQEGEILTLVSITEVDGTNILRTPGTATATTLTMSPGPELGGLLGPFLNPEGYGRRHGSQLEGIEVHELGVTPGRNPAEGNNKIEIPAKLQEISSQLQEEGKTEQTEGNSVEKKLTEILETAFRGLAETVKPKKNTGCAILPKFEGSDWEDPKAFLINMRRICETEGLHANEWTSFTAARLQGNASQWHNYYRDFELDFYSFCQRLLDKYDSIEVRSRLQARMYGERQGREPASVFITRKMALIKRFAPYMSEEDKVCFIKAL